MTGGGTGEGEEASKRSHSHPHARTPLYSLKPLARASFPSLPLPPTPRAV